jgi:hypothetical protein
MYVCVREDLRILRVNSRIVFFFASLQQRRCLAVVTILDTGAPKTSLALEI